METRTIKTLRIKDEKEARELVTFDEYLDDDGSWVKSYGTYHIRDVRHVNTNSTKYEYFITEDEQTNHSILRNRIKRKEQ